MKNLFQKILEGLGFGGIAIVGWVGSVIYGLSTIAVGVAGLVIAIAGIRIIIDGEVWRGLLWIFVFAPIAIYVGYFILHLIFAIVGGVLFAIGADIYYLIKGIGKLLSRDKWLGKGE